MLRFFPSFCLAVLLLAGCAGSEDVPVEEEPPPEPEEVISAVGMVRYVDLEGGFYGIVAEQGVGSANEGGTQYLPLNLGEAYRQDGLRVRFRAVPIDTVATIQMWGHPIEIRDIQRVDVR